MATSRRDFLRASMVSGLAAAAAATFPAWKALAQPAAPMAGEYQHAQDPAHLTPLEMSHWPKLSISKKTPMGQPFNLMIQIGNKLHPMTAEHHIEWVEVWAGDKRLLRTDFIEPTWTKPVLTVNLSAVEATQLKVRMRCNLHGLWENSIKLQPGNSMAKPSKSDY